MSSSNSDEIAIEAIIESLSKSYGKDYLGAIFYTTQECEYISEQRDLMQFINWGKLCEEKGHSIEFLDKHKEYIPWPSFLEKQDLFDPQYYTADQMYHAEILLKEIRGIVTRRFVSLDCICYRQSLPQEFTEELYDEMGKRAIGLLLSNIDNKAKYSKHFLTRMVETMYCEGFPTEQDPFDRHTPTEKDMWHGLVLAQDLPMDLMYKYSDKLDDLWPDVFRNQYIDEDFIEEFKHFVPIHEYDADAPSWERKECLGELLIHNKRISDAVRIKYMRESGIIETEGFDDILDETERKLAVQKLIEFEADLNELEDMI
jgi:hypothetical protein